MSSKTLISVMEVIASTPVDHNYDPRLLYQFLKDAEYKLCTDCCFGEDFYLDLLDKCKDTEEYDDCKDYSIGAVVIFGAKVYEAIGDPPAGTNPDEDPGVWSETPKFTDANYQDLYDKHLRELLAFCVLHSSIITTAIRVSTFGVMKNTTEYSESADDKSVLLLKSDLQNRIETRRDFMDKYLTRVNESLGINNPERFPLYPANIELNCGTGCNNTRYKDPVNIPFLGAGKKKKKCDVSDK